MQKGIIFSVFALLFLCFTGVSNAVVYMPNYDSPQIITENLSAPTAVAIDSSGNLYVLESVYGKLYKYDSSGNYVETFTGLNEPVSIAIESSGNIFIGSKATGRVDVYDSAMNQINYLGGGDGEFSHPNAIAIDSSSGKIYVSDGQEDLIKIYNLSDYLFNSSFAGTAGGGSLFTYPNGIAVDDSAGELIVTDLKVVVSGQGAYETARVQVFDLSGNFLRTFGALFGIGDGKLFRPAGVVVDSLSRVYVSDAFQNITQVFDNLGGSLGTVYNLDNPMRTPVGIAADSGKLYVASLNAAKVDVYSMSEPAGNPEIKIEPNPDPYDFGNVSVGYTSQPPPPQTFTISNIGLGDLVITAVSVTGEFSIPVDNCLGQTLAYLEECTVDVEFSPLTAGAKAGTLTIRDTNYPTVPEGTASLTGTGVSGNTPPTGDAGGPYSATEGQSILLDGSASSDSDGTIYLYEWDIDDDGTYEYSSPLPTQLHTYAQQGTYTIRLRVTDNLDATDDQATATANIADSVPTANFTGSPTSGVEPLTVNFTNSSTGYDQPLTYEWDFDFINDPGTKTSSAQNPSYIFSVGTYTVKLTVTDADLSTNSMTRTDYIVVTASGGCANEHVMIGGIYHSTFQGAYDSAFDGDNIQSHDTIYYDFTEDVNFNRNISVTLSGGYNCDYSAIVGETVIQGIVTFSDGIVTISNGTICIK